MNIQQIEDEFRIRFFEDFTGDRKNLSSEAVKQFYREEITELLNSLKMEERDMEEFSGVCKIHKESEWCDCETYNQVARELNDKIDGIIK